MDPDGADLHLMGPIVNCGAALEPDGPGQVEKWGQTGATSDGLH